MTCVKNDAHTKHREKTMTRFLFPLFLCALMLVAGPAFAGANDWKMTLQDPATPAMEHITEFHTMLLYIITAIVVFVTGLLIYVMVRFNAKANPVPSTTTHNVLLEVIWTVVPVLILVMIAVPSFKLLFFEARNPEPEMTVKVTGYQWYWGYEFPDNGNISVTSNMIADKDVDAAKGQKRLLSTDNPIYLPIDTNINFEVTASDVLHSFAVPAFGIKTDAVTGRLNSSWARITKPGVYYGQCSELCGKGHGAMPIEIHAVSKEEFAAWVKSQGGTMKGDTPATDAIPAAEPSPVSKEPAKNK